ncbi:hypothetical protein [Haloarcula pellucida]|uniref:hypothetical protein n=1 Tax=Haloarcula pellucida TaxID=1427151 RepID=UPI0016649C87|nr:hypothetical protein [Halomicroarcula pellucida]MBX0347190.1 hypothetical protein [Halomicroarcula pellucida]
MTTNTTGVSVTNSPVTEAHPATVGPVRTSDRDAIVEEAAGYAGIHRDGAGKQAHTGGCKFVQIFATPGWRSASVCYSHQYQSGVGQDVVDRARVNVLF